MPATADGLQEARHASDVRWTIVGDDKVIESHASNRRLA